MKATKCRRSNTAPTAQTAAYGGLNIGGAWTRTDFSPSTMLTLAPTTVVNYPTVRADSSAVIGGGQAGYNLQLGSWVVGVEQDFQFTRLKPGFTYATTPPPGTPLLAGDGFSAKIKYMGATRGRIGWAWDHALLYVSGGLETAIVDGTGNYVAPPLSPGLIGLVPASSFTDSDKFHVGWTIGTGFEYAVTNSVSLGLDYRYFDLESRTYNLGAVTPSVFVATIPPVTIPGTPSTVAVNIHPRGSELLARLNVKFNALGLSP
jgi:outer membrane immunogenic protein